MEPFIMWREVPIEELPMGFYREQMLALAERQAKVIVVAREGGNDDWAAYVGWPDSKFLKEDKKNNYDILYYCQTVRTVHQVAESGDKLLEEEARAVFPELAAKSYRR